MIRLTSMMFLFLLLQFTTEAQTNILRFKRITTQQGLSENRVSSIFQDDAGALWIGSRIAVNRYDGEVSTVYHIGQNIIINQFFEDYFKNMWVATDHGLYFFDKKRDNFIKITSSINKVSQLFNSNISCISNTIKNELLISGDESFMVKLKVNNKGEIVPNSLKIIAIPLKSGYVTKIVKDSNSKLWLGTSKGEVLCVQNGVFTAVDFLKSQNSQFINDMSTDDFNNLWIGTNGNGLFRYNIKDKTIKHFLKGENIEGRTINNDVVTRIYTKDKNVWIGTDGGGLNLYVQDKNTFSYYMYDFGNEFSISDNSIIDIQPGLNDVILLGTVHGGVSIFRNNYKIQNIAPKNLKFINQDPQGSRVLEDSFKNIWFSAGRKGLRRYNPATKALSVFSGGGSDTAFNGDIVLSLFEDKSKRLWVGTLREGVSVYDLVNNRFMALPQGKEFNGVFSIAEDAEQNIWIGHRKGINIYSRDLKLINQINLSLKPFSRSNQITCIYKDVAGGMWIGTAEGLFKFEKRGNSYLKTIYKHSSTDVNSLSSNNILSIGEAHDFSIFVGTYGYGLNKFVRETGRFKRFNSKNKIKGEIIRGILHDNQKNIWLSTNAGLTKIDLQNNVTNFGVTDGVFPFNGGAASLDSSGKIVMAGVFGLSYFKPEKLMYKNYSPNVYFTSVKAVDGKNESVYSFSELANDTVVIEPGNKLVNINFASSELYSRSSIEYQYLMEGLYDNWQNLGGQNKISFSNLNPGQYHLKVRATNNSKLWNNKYTTLYIVVKPSFWQRPFVRFMMVLCGIALLLWLYNWRTSNINKQRENLKKLLDLKTIEVKEQEQKISQNKISMLEIEKQNQALKQKKLEDELKFKIDELTNNTLRAMHKNNLLTDVKDKLKVELKNKIIEKKSLEDIISNINDSFILDADWDSFYTLFNQVHPGFIKSLKLQYPNLSEREIRLCALILIDFSSQHIATLFGISLTSVKVARHRLRKKLNISNDESVKKFMSDIDRLI